MGESYGRRGDRIKQESIGIDGRSLNRGIGFCLPDRQTLKSTGGTKKSQNEPFRQKDSLRQGMVSCVSKNLFSKAPWHGAQPHIKSRMAYLEYWRANMAEDGLKPENRPHSRIEHAQEGVESLPERVRIRR